METTAKIISEWLDTTQQDLIENYDRLKLRASGRWANSLEQFQKDSGTSINLGITGEQYTGALEFGRRSNRDQSPEGLRNWAVWAGKSFIKKWCEDKGIPSEFSIQIAYKIAKQGWKVPNPKNTGGLVSDVLTDDRYNSLMKKLSLFFVNEIKTDIVNTLAFGNNYDTLK